MSIGRPGGPDDDRPGRPIPAMSIGRPGGPDDDRPGRPIPAMSIGRPEGRTMSAREFAVTWDYR